MFIFKATEFTLIFDLDEFLGAVGWVGDIKLYLNSRGRGVKMIEVISIREVRSSWIFA